MKLSDFLPSIARLGMVRTAFAAALGLTKPFSKILLVSLCTGSIPAAQAYTNLAYAKQCRGRVVLLDGTEIVGTVKLPTWSEKKIHIKADEGGSQSISSDRIDMLVLWSKKNPESQYVLAHRTVQYVQRKGKNGRPDKTKLSPQWVLLKSVGEHMTIFEGADSYQMSRKGEGILLVAANAFEVLLFKSGADIGVKVGNMPRYTNPRFMEGTRQAFVERLCALCADDPVFCRRLQDGDLDPLDFDQLTEAYRPEK